MRGILASDYGVDTERLRWFTQEDAHVAEYREPPGVERVAADKNLLKMLREGELDAAIHGADLPKDPSLMSVIPTAPKGGRHRPSPIRSRGLPAGVEGDD